MTTANKVIYVAGHKGLVGSAIFRALEANGEKPIGLERKSLDLMDKEQVDSFYARYKPHQVYIAAAKVGGIKANDTFPADFLYQNLQIQNNLIHGAYRNGVHKLLFLGSSCIYPKMAPQPIKEESLLTGPLEPTNEAYAIAKIAGIKMCQFYRRQYGCDFISAMPTNLYGPNDNYDAHNSHVLPAMLRRYHEAKRDNLPSVTCWGTGMPLREFLHVDDLAQACLLLMEKYSGEQHINVGSGVEHTIADIAYMIRQIVGYEGLTMWDPTKPDGTPRKLMDSGRMFNLGWRPSISLREGLSNLYTSSTWNLASEQPNGGPAYRGAKGAF